MERFTQWAIAAIAVVTTCLSSITAVSSPHTDWANHPIGGVLALVIPIVVSLDWARRFLKPREGE